MGIYADRRMETSTTTGAGNITLAGAVIGYKALFGGKIVLNAFFDYCIEAVDGSGIPTGEWETGEGYLSGSTTLVRAVVAESSNANALVSFAVGTKRVFIAFGASEIQDKGQIFVRANYLALN